MRIKTDAVGQVVARPEEHRWVDYPWPVWRSDEGDDEDEVAAPTSLWEAEICALDNARLHNQGMRNPRRNYANKHKQDENKSEKEPKRQNP